MSNVLSVLSFIAVALEVLLIFNLIIIVHELGHFLAARWRGLMVEEFGVWFGKPLWRKKVGDVWYSLGSIPAGGFVKLPQMAPMETIEGESDTPHEQLPPVRPLDKIIVAFAGPFFSFLLALALGCVTWAVGTPTSQPDTTTEVGYIKPNSPAERAQFKVGDKIKAIDGKPVTRFMGQTNSVIWGVMSSQNDTINFLIERDGQEMQIVSGYTKEPNAGWRRRSPRTVGIGPRIVPEVGVVHAGTPGAQAGLQVGDVVTSVNGKPVYTLTQLPEILAKDGRSPLALTVQRGNQSIDLTIPAIPMPASKEEGWNIPGIDWGRVSFEHPTPFQQVGNSIKAMKNVLTAVTSPKGDIGVDQMSGPIGIMNLYRRILEMEEGWRLAIAFSVFFNVNLALLNLLPFPVLDGGHITLGILEGIRRKPINTKVLEVLQTACALLLVGFIVFVSFFDVSDLVPKQRKEPQSEQKVSK